MSDRGIQGRDLDINSNDDNRRKNIEVENTEEEWDELVDLLAPSRQLPDNINLDAAPSLFDTEQLTYRSCEVAHLPVHTERTIERNQLQQSSAGLTQRLPCQNPFLQDPFHKDFDFESEFDSFPGESLFPMLHERDQIQSKGKAGAGSAPLGTGDSATFPVLPVGPWRLSHTHIALPAALSREQVISRVDCSLECVGVHVLNFQESNSKWIAAAYIQSELVLFRVRIFTRPAGRVSGIDFPETIVEFSKEGGSGLCFHTLWRSVVPLLEGAAGDDACPGDAPVRPALFKALPMQSRPENLDAVAEMLEVSKGDVGARREAAQILANVAEAEHSAVRLKLGLDSNHSGADNRMEKQNVEVTLAVCARALSLALPLLNVADALSSDNNSQDASELRETARAAATTVSMACRTCALALESASTMDNVSVTGSDSCLAAGQGAVPAVAKMLHGAGRAVPGPRVAMVAEYDEDDDDVKADARLRGEVLSLRATSRAGVLSTEQSAARRETRRCGVAAVACLAKAFPELIRENGLIDDLQGCVKTDGGDAWLRKYASAALSACNDN